MIEATRLSIPDLILVRPARHEDARGFFIESFNRNVFASVGIDVDFVQDNHSLSRAAGTVRGLHFQLPPHAQAKLVRVLRGSVLDVAVDIRHGSPTFGRHCSAILTASGGEQIFVPPGFAHGFCTLEPDTEVFYKVDAFYAPEADRGIHWRDPALAIEWPVAAEAGILSAKDAALPPLEQVPYCFQHGRC